MTAKHLLLLCCIAALTACSTNLSTTTDKEAATLAADAPAAVRDYSVPAFTGLQADGTISVECLPATAEGQRVSVSAPAELLPYLKVQVEKQMLCIEYEGLQVLGSNSGGCKFKLGGRTFTSRANLEQTLNTHVTLRTALPCNVSGSSGVKISLPQGGSCDQSFSLSLSSGASLYAKGTLSLQREANIALSSGALCQLDGFDAHTVNCAASSGALMKAKLLTCTDLQVAASSGAAATLKGNCSQANLVASSGAELDLADMKARKVQAAASSGGEIDSPLTGELTVGQSSGGSVHWKGRPRVTKL
ncbi:MAG: GIN domain-containing protein [Alloprevotella sp.]